MIAVAEDAQGLRQAALELLEERFASPERARTEQLAAQAADPEEVRMRIPSTRTLSPGYYIWLEYVAEAIEMPLACGLRIDEAKLSAEELLTLGALREARADFELRHPPCGGCGTPLANAWDKACSNCQAAVAAARSR